MICTVLTLLHSPLVLMALSVAPAIVILGYYMRISRSAPEPWSRVIACFVAGAVAFAIAAPLEGQLAQFVPRERPWIWALVVVAPVEETLKLLAVLAAGPSTRRYDRVSSGVIYGVAAAAGFACIENVAYVREFGFSTAVLRAVTAVPAHTLHGALSGLGLGVLHRVHPHRRARVAANGLAAAILLHAAYDGLLLGGGSLRGLVVVLVTAEALFVHFVYKRVREADLRRDMDLLAAVPILRGASAAALRVLALGAVRQHVAEQSRVVRWGQPGDALFVILRGELCVRRDKEIITHLRDGEVFGERSLLTGSPRSADVTATADSLVLRVPRAALLRAVLDVPGLADALIAEARVRFGDDVALDPDGLRETARRVIAAERPEGLAARLGQIELFEGLDTPDLEELANACVVVQQRAGTRLARKGRGGPGLCLLLAGQARAYRRRRLVADMAEGDFFGELNLLTGWPASATVIASNPVRIAALRWVDVEPVIARNPELGLRLLRVATHRVVDASDAKPSGWMWPTRLYKRARRTLGFARDPGAGALYAAFPQIRTLPPSTLEALGLLARRCDKPMAEGISFSPDAGAVGSVLGREAVVSEGRWWHLSQEDLHDAIARCPSVVRFVARVVLSSTTNDEAGHLTVPR